MALGAQGRPRNVREKCPPGAPGNTKNANFDTLCSSISAVVSARLPYHMEPTIMIEFSLIWNSKTLMPLILKLKKLCNFLSQFL